MGLNPYSLSGIAAAASARLRRTLACIVLATDAIDGVSASGDATLRAAALREATEESGISGLEIGTEPLHVDVHPVTCSLGVPTRHLDVRYLVHAPPGAQAVISDESDDLRWWPVDALPPDSDTLPAMTALARAAHRDPPLRAFMAP